MLKTFLHYWYTMRNLRLRQILARIWLRLRRVWERPPCGPRRAAPAYPGYHGRTALHPLPSRDFEKSRDEILSGRLTFLNETKDVGWPPRWGSVQGTKLWLYHLQYFDYLWALDFGHAREVVLDWIATHSQPGLPIAWEPYPISLRLVNWCGVLFGRFRNEVEADREFVQEVWRSIYFQAEWLRRHLELHLLGNHLLENAAALALTGACFKHGPAARWYQTGLRILRQQVPEQILRDGVHFERSPMYHSRMTYALAALMNTAEPELTSIVHDPLERMIRALECMTHPDGEIALLNDSVLGEYPPLRDLKPHVEDLLVSYHERGIGCFVLRDSGYYGWYGDDGSYVICDAARIGPDYLPGHAHGDIFSFEMSLKGQRIIVDSGVFDYEPGEMRDYCRSTRAHNTVEVDGQDQCEFWGVFRVARRGRPRDVSWQPRRDGFDLIGWHDGYHRLRGRPSHTREFTWHERGSLEIRDTLISSEPAEIVSRIHLHPTCEIVSVEGAEVTAACPAGRFRVAFFGEGRLDVAPSWYCPEFGVKLDNKCLAFKSAGRRVQVDCRVELLGEVVGGAG